MAQYYLLSSGQAFNLKTRTVDVPQALEYPLTLAVHGRQPHRK